MAAMPSTQSAVDAIDALGRVKLPWTLTTLTPERVIVMAAPHHHEDLTAEQQASVDYTLSQLAPRLRQALIARVLEEGPLDEDDTDTLVSRVVAAFPQRHEFDQQVGPFYDTSGLLSWIGGSRQALFGRVQRGRVIACQLESGSWVYPTWQFRADGTVDDAHMSVWRALRGPQDAPAADPWTCALWMCAPHPDLEHISPVEWIRAGNDLELVLTLARQVSARWAQ